MSLYVVVDVPLHIDEVPERVENCSEARERTVVGLVVVRI